jgi:hypothetical protein
MATPMALMGMEPVEVEQESVTSPVSWDWQPDVIDLERLTEATTATRQTSRKTNSKQTDYGEGQ